MSHVLRKTLTPHGVNRTVQSWGTAGPLNHCIFAICIEDKCKLSMLKLWHNAVGHATACMALASDVLLEAKAALRWW